MVKDITSINITGTCQVDEWVDGKPTKSTPVRHFGVAKTYGNHHGSLCFSDDSGHIRLADNTPDNIELLKSNGYIKHREHPAYFSNNQVSLSDDVNRFLKEAPTRMEAYNAATAARMAVQEGLEHAAPHASSSGGGLGAAVKQSLKTGVRSL